MAGEAGSRPYWPVVHGVDVGNGNPNLAFGSGTCATCSGGGSGRPDPRATALTGPVVVFNSLGAPDTDLGPKWMTPFDISLEVDGSGNVSLIDGCATREYFYQDTDDAHDWVAGRDSHLRKTLDKKSGGATICSFGYELDAAGTRLSQTDKDTVYTGYGYDPAYRLVSESRWSSKASGSRLGQFAWFYDPNGNRLGEFEDAVLTPYAYGDDSRLLSAGDATFTYDHFGNTKTKTVNSDVTTYVWDFESHLIGTEYPASDPDTHEYDGDGTHAEQARRCNGLDELRV